MDVPVIAVERILVVVVPDCSVQPLAAGQFGNGSARIPAFNPAFHGDGQADAGARGSQVDVLIIGDMVLAALGPLVAPLGGLLGSGLGIPVALHDHRYIFSVILTPIDDAVGTEDLITGTVLRSHKGFIFAGHGQQVATTLVVGHRTDGRLRTGCFGVGREADAVIELFDHL